MALPLRCQWGVEHESLQDRPGSGSRSLCRVLGVVGEPPNGVSYVRFLQPFAYLESMGYRLETLGESISLHRTARGYAPTPSLLDGVRMAIFPQTVASPVLADGLGVDLVGPICDMAERSGAKVVYSVDDYLEGIEVHNPAYDTVTAAMRNLHTILERADAIIVTTEVLRDTLSAIGKPIELLPNAVEPSRWRQRPGASGELRVGWTGSGSHLHDLLMVVPAIRRLQRRTTCRFFLQGLVDRPIPEEARRVRRIRRELPSAQRATADAFLELASALESIDYTHLPFAPVQSFFDLLPEMDLDVGICPLLDSAFNRHKSANKFYEYAATGTMTIASAVVPYVDEVSVTVPNDDEAWSDAIEHFLRSEKDRDAELDRQRDFVLAERNIERLRFRWAEALNRILNTDDTGGARPALPSCA